ncbi:MAG: RDD family protein [Blastocatellia bacterium]|nr:RDD family protein [Blastocatellia bacterium]MDW8168091.1 RDD family protein [Acidobacteriota bacterium]MDW8257660.1 RDD family protein [Acidobacteriota bacterium]
MRCPKCGFVQSAAQATCRYCGTKLSPTTAPSAQAHERADDRARAHTASSVVIPFPGARARDVASNRPVPDSSDDSSAEERSGPPEWREQLRERVRAIRERRGSEGESARKVAEPSPPANPEKERRNAIAETVAARARRHDELAPAPRRGGEVVNPSPHPEVEVQPRAPRERESAREATPLFPSDEELLLEEGRDLASEREMGPEVSLRPRSREPQEIIREEPQIAPASLGRRIGAALLDLGVILFSAIPFVASVELIFGDFSHRFVRFALVGIVIGIGVLYETIMLSVAGRTVGMAIAGLLALNARTMDVPLAGQALRHVLGSVLGAIPLFFGFFWALFNRERRTFADLFSGIVVKRVAESVYESQEVHAPWLYRPSRR